MRRQPCFSPVRGRLWSTLIGNLAGQFARPQGAVIRSDPLPETRSEWQRAHWERQRAKTPLPGASDPAL